MKKNIISNKKPLIIAVITSLVILCMIVFAIACKVDYNEICTKKVQSTVSDNNSINVITEDLQTPTDEEIGIYEDSDGRTYYVFPQNKTIYLHSEDGYIYCFNPINSSETDNKDVYIGNVKIYADDFGMKLKNITYEEK